MRGHHVAVRAPSLAEATDFYVGKLDFRVLAEWSYEDEKLAYLAPPTDDHFYVEVLGDGDTLPVEVRRRGPEHTNKGGNDPLLTQRGAIWPGLKLRQK